MHTKPLLFFSAVLLLSAITLNVNAQKSCKALVMQGGGSKGAYEAGVLSAFFYNSTNPSDFEYDVITGISIGAVNAMALAQYPKGQEQEAIDFLLNGWRTTSNKDVYVNYPGGLVQGLFFEPSLLNNDNEIGLLSKWIQAPPVLRKVTVVATDFNTGLKRSWNEQDWQNNASMAIQAALLSSSVPTVFKYRHFEDNIYIDGGWSGEGLDVEDAVFRCREQVDSDDQITIDVIFAGNISFSAVDKNNFNSFQMHQRFQDIKSFAYATRSFRLAVENFPDVNFRYVAVSSERLPDQSVPLEFNQKNIEFMIQLGIKDGIDALNEGPGYSAQKVFNFAKQYDDDIFFNNN